MYSITARAEAMVVRDQQLEGRKEYYMHIIYCIPCPQHADLQSRHGNPTSNKTAYIKQPACRMKNKELFKK